MYTMLLKITNPMRIIVHIRQIAAVILPAVPEENQRQPHQQQIPIRLHFLQVVGSGCASILPG